VHGLQGHPQRTWSSGPISSPKIPGEARARSPFRLFSLRKREVKGKNATIKVEETDNKAVFWPNLLQVDLPKARILMFGYDTNITRGYAAANQNNIFSHAKDLLYGLEAKRRKAPSRDLVFIAHSLGGIIVKEVLRRSEVDPDPKLVKVFESTTGVFFFGTPHRGSRDWASFGEGISSIASRVIGLDVNSQIIHALLPSGPELELCRESFTTQWVKRGDKLTVRTFQESKGVTGIRWNGLNHLVWHNRSQNSFFRQFSID
jgi:hypothetical protein